jgi:hypothetical protein
LRTYCRIWSHLPGPKLPTSTRDASPCYTKLYIITDVFRVGDTSKNFSYQFCDFALLENSQIMLLNWCALFKPSYHLEVFRYGVTIGSTISKPDSHFIFSSNRQNRN